MQAVESYINNPEDNILITNSPDDKVFLNTKIREMLKGQPESNFETLDGEIKLAAGDKIIFYNKSSEDKYRGVITSIDENNNLELKIGENLMKISTALYHIEYGHAVAIADGIESNNATLVHTGDVITHSDLYKAADNTPHKFKVITMDKNKLINPESPGFDKEYSCTPVHANFISRLESYNRKKNLNIVKSAIFNLENNGCLKEYNADTLWRTKGVLEGRHYRYKIDRYKMSKDKVQELTRYHIRMQAIEDMLTTPDSIIITSDKEQEIINRYARERSVMKETEQTVMANGAKLQLAAGDRIILTEENKELNVPAGTMGVVNLIDSQGNISVDTGIAKLNINAKEYNHIKYGYAAGVDDNIRTQRVILLHTEGIIDTDELSLTADKAAREMKVYTADKSGLGAEKEKEAEKQV